VRTAVVVGAGVGGLAVAGGLARTGWHVTLLERADRLRPGRAAVLLWPSGVAALRSLGLGAGLDAIGSPVPPAGMRRANGQWLRRPDRPPLADRLAGTGTPATPGWTPAATAPAGATAPVVVHREDLHDAFVAGLGDSIDIRTGVAVRAVRPTGDRPSVSDGRGTWEADLVVAADGLHSTVRQRLAPQSQVVSGGCTAWRAVVPWYRAPELPADIPPSGDILGVGHRFAHASLGERGSSGGSRRGGIYWVALAPGASRPEPLDVQLGLLRRWFAGWPSPVTELLAVTEPDDLVQETVAEVAPLPASFGYPAGTGGYALLGDAAHGLVDHAGLGACLALEDAAALQALLVDAVLGASLAEALDAYTKLRRPRVARLARQSRRLGAVLQARGRLAVRARDVALGALVPRLSDSLTTAMTQWHPPAR
jgi:2-polyprenyl-6-methoxyphenol hydroxylase-like FAD-dependent oxidoreductase